MRGRGIHYDTGTTPDGTSSRPQFEPAVVAREMQVIAQDLHCTAVRVSGGDPDRLSLAGLYAADSGLQVWFSPHPCELTAGQLRPYLLDCAERAEHLRLAGANVVLVAGCELSLFTQGYLPGDTFSARMQTLTGPAERRAQALAAIPERINTFLAELVPRIRTVFTGALTYASIPIEHIDWTPFDIIGIDAYRSLRNHATYRQELRHHVATGKPVAVTEAGCCTYRGAADLGAAGWLVLQPEGRIAAGTIRDEHEQSRHLYELMSIFDAEGIDTAFWFTLAAYTLKHRADPSTDTDIGSYGITKIIDNNYGGTRTYPELPWEPKAAFHALAQHYTNDKNTDR